MAKGTELKQSAKSEKPSKNAKNAKPEKKSVIYKLKKYFKDLKSEFKKVVWPSKKQVRNNTGVVLVTMVIAGIFIWGIDTAFSQILKLVLGA